MQDVQQLLESALADKVKFEQNDDEFSFVLTCRIPGFVYKEFYKKHNYMPSEQELRENVYKSCVYDFMQQLGFEPDQIVLTEDEYFSLVYG